MGVFSYLCAGCLHPLLPDHQLHINRWMNEAVAVLEDGKLRLGNYDGYGRIGGVDLPKYIEYNAARRAVTYEQAFTVWHRACWTLLGAPMTCGEQALNAEDQGYFYAVEDHALPEPRTQRDVEEYRMWKQRTLPQKIAYLRERGVDPFALPLE